MWLKRRYILQHGTDQFTITLNRDHMGRLAVQLDEGDLIEVDACFVGNGRSLSLRRNGRMHLIEMTSCDNRGKVEATVGGRSLNLTVMDELKALAKAAPGMGSSSGAITVDIPGLVVALNAGKGQKVKRGETLLVLEAMKMQNDITAPITGTVVELKVDVGNSVNTGDLLLVIEPDTAV